MKIFEPIVATGYEWLNGVHAADYEVLLGLDGRPRAPDWAPIEVKRVRADNRQKMRESDFPWLGSQTLVLRRSAAEALRDMVTTQGELLPLLDTTGVELFALNAQTIDALDEEASDIWRFPGTNRIMSVERPAFLATRIKSSDIFRLPHRAGSTYVSERFVERVRACGLRGLDFPEVWST